MARTRNFTRAGSCRMRLSELSACRPSPETTAKATNPCVGSLAPLRGAFPTRPPGPISGHPGRLARRPFLKGWLAPCRVAQLDACPTADLAGRPGSYPLRADSNRKSQALRALDSLGSLLRGRGLRRFHATPETSLRFDRKELNLRQSAFKADALPAELLAPAAMCVSSGSQAF